MEVQQQQQQQQLGLGLGLGFWEQDATTTSSSSLMVGLKLCLPLPSKLSESDLKAENPIQLNNYSKEVSDKSSSEDLKQHVSPSGGTRWNPTSEQIAALEALYIGGMRTPSAQDIEGITFDLSKYGRIEGKNVFYWFQNHKARERQKQKRSSLLSLPTTTTTTTTTTSTAITAAPTSTTFLLSQCRGKEVKEWWCDPSKKRKCGNWEVQVSEEKSGSDGTLELFPLHPEL